MSASRYLIGGGRDPVVVAASHGPFVRAAAARGGPIVAVALADPDRWRADLEHAGAVAVEVVVGRVPSSADLAGASGIFVAGGETPEYQALLCDDPSWLPRDLPYAGFSAGAAIAPNRALVGGWRVDGVAVCDEEVGEGLDAVEVRPGLGLVPFTVDVHAAQWGTLGRLVAAVEDTGWALDEGTCLEVGPDGEAVAVHGVGRAWHVRHEGSGVRVTPVRAGEALP